MSGGQRDGYESDSVDDGSPPSQFLSPPMLRSGHSSVCSSATSTPVPSRAGSPLPQFLISNPSYSSSSYTESDSEHEFSASLFRNRRSSWRTDRQQWWQLPRTGRRRRDCSLFRVIKRWFRRLVRHPFVPKTPLAIVSCCARFC